MVSGMHDEGSGAGIDGSNGFDGFDAFMAMGMAVGGAADYVAAQAAGHAEGDDDGAKRPVDRFVQEQLFEEDVRAVLSVMRPNRRERLLGWSEYRTGGAHFRATISWAPEFAKQSASTTAAPGDEQLARLDAQLSVPRLTDVLESILVGSVKNQDELHAAEEFEIYRGVVRELYRRLDEMQSCYE